MRIELVSGALLPIAGTPALGFRVSGSGFGFRVSGSGSLVPDNGVGFRVSGFRTISDFEFDYSFILWFRVPGFRPQDYGLGFQVSGSG